MHEYRWINAAGCHVKAQLFRPKHSKSYLLGEVAKKRRGGYSLLQIYVLRGHGRWRGSCFTEADRCFTWSGVTVSEIESEREKLFCLLHATCGWPTFWLFVLLFFICVGTVIPNGSRSVVGISAFVLFVCWHLATGRDCLGFRIRFRYC